MDSNEIDDRSTAVPQATAGGTEWMVRADALLGELWDEGMRLINLMDVQAPVSYVEQAGLCAQLAAVRAREAAWYRLMARHVTRGSAGGAGVRALILAARARRADARFWRGQSRTWAAHAVEAMCVAPGAPRFGKSVPGGAPMQQRAGGV